MNPWKRAYGDGIIQQVVTVQVGVGRVLETQRSGRHERTTLNCYTGETQLRILVNTQYAAEMAHELRFYFDRITAEELRAMERELVSLPGGVA